MAVKARRVVPPAALPRLVGGHLGDYGRVTVVMAVRSRLVPNRLAMMLSGGTVRA